MIGLLISAATTSYALIDEYFYQPEKQRNDGATFFSNEFIPRPLDRYGRIPLSIFQNLNDRSRGIYGMDAACLLAAEYSADTRRFIAATYLAAQPWIAGLDSQRRKGFFSNIFSPDTRFNADSIFGMWTYAVYWHGGSIPKEWIFDRIINLMYNRQFAGKKTSNDNPFTDHNRRFFMPYTDIIELNRLAEARENTNFVRIYKGGKAINLCARMYARSLRATLARFPYTSGYFIDALRMDDPYDIVRAEIELFANSNPQMRQILRPLHGNILKKATNKRLFICISTI